MTHEVSDDICTWPLVQAGPIVQQAARAIDPTWTTRPRINGFIDIMRPGDFDVRVRIAAPPEWRMCTVEASTRLGETIYGSQQAFEPDLHDFLVVVAVERAVRELLRHIETMKAVTE